MKIPVRKCPPISTATTVKFVTLADLAASSILKRMASWHLKNDGWYGYTDSGTGDRVLLINTQR